MFTIKHRSPFGNEALYRAANTQFCPIEGAPANQPVGFATAPLGVLYYRGDTDGPLHELEQIDSGQVYVMNEAGSTVAHYDLGGWVVSNPPA
jgi:hypothetical protein